MSIASEHKVLELEQRVATLEAQIIALASVVRQLEQQKPLGLKRG